MNYPRVLSNFTLVIILILLAGCGGDDSPDINAPPTEPVPEVEPLFDETSAVIGSAIASMEHHLDTLELADAMTAVAAEMQIDTCVVSAVCIVDGTADPYLLAEFTNGILYFMPVVRLEDQEKTAVDPPGEDRSKSLVDSAITGNNRAFVIDLPEFGSCIFELSEAASDIGYTVNYVSEPLVESFEGLDQYGLIYIGTHGHYFEHQGVYYFSLLTHEPRNSTQDTNFLIAFDFQTVSVILESHIVIVEEEDFLVSEDVNYAVTNNYIARHNGAFPHHTLFYAASCQSGMRENVEMAPPLAETLNELNVETYLGWSNFVSISALNRATDFLFAHMLGEIPEGVPNVPVTGPPIRPATLVDSYVALQTRNWHVDELTPFHAVLELFDFSEGQVELLIRPSIGQMPVDVYPEDRNQELQLLGDFGFEPGKVFICENPEQTNTGGTELSVENWEQDEIIVDLSGGQHGYVVVESGGRRSNAHPLTKWSAEVDVSGTFPSGHGPRFELTMHSIWRAEIVEERPMPDSDPFPQFGWSNTGLGLDSVCDYQYSGNFEDANYIYEYQEDLNTGSLEVLISGGTEHFFGVVVLKPSETNATIQASFAHDAQVWVTDKHEPNAHPVLETRPVIVSIYIDAEMEARGNISSGEMVNPHNVSWPDVQPESPPVDSTGQ